VGIILPLTGPEARFALIEKNSFLMGLDEINAAGGVNGRQIELVVEDDHSEVSVASSVVQKLITQDMVVMLAGGYSSELSFAISALSQQKRVPFLVNTATADRITEQGWDYVFRLATPASEHPNALISFLREVVKPRTAAIIYPSNQYGEAASRKFVEYCKRIRVGISFERKYKSGEADFISLLRQVKELKPDLVYMVAHLTDGVALMNQARDADFSPKLFVGGSPAFAISEFGREAGEASENVFATTPWTPNVTYPGAKRYYESYLKRFSEHPEYHGAQAYAAMYVIADALQRTEELTPSAVREALTKTDMMTAFGPVKFIDYGRKRQQNSVPTYVVQWQKGKLETVWPRGVAEKLYVFPVPPWPR
jgi:branched-chain amino acid transport system substrate-binding protein